MAKLHTLSKIFNTSLNRKFCNLRYFKNCNQLNNYESFRAVNTSSACNSQQPPPENRTLVYEAPLKRRLKITKLLSLSSSMVGFAVLPVFLKDMWHTSPVFACATGIVSTGFLCTPFLLHWITKKYILELTYDPVTKIFYATTFNLASQKKQITFTASDVTIPDLPGMFTSFKVKNTPYFVDSNMVKDPDAYCLMMGYDKPFDFKLESEREKTV
ncbi:transmembrane protein 70 homolog, mitochondrial [Parasteatoda tepidariorum]|nr:transmembrane protein 70 homolog, mitochondrial [Parasteatoda tepidariorum]